MKKTKRKKQNLISVKLAMLLTFVVIAAIGVTVIALNINRFKLSQKEVTIEAGTLINPADYIKNAKDINAVEYVSSVNNIIPGEYTIDYFYEGKHCSTLIVKVVDTIAPVIIPKEDEIVLYTNESINPDELVSSYSDITSVSISYNAAEINVSLPGIYTLTVSATDLGGNISTTSATVRIKEKDLAAPVITISNNNITIDQGEGYDFYSDVTITDEDENIEINVDYGDFDSNIPGTYTITYEATDSYGNTSTKSRTITVEGTNQTTTVSQPSNSAVLPFIGLSTISVFQGESVDLMSGVSLNPAQFAEGAEFAVDSSTLNVNVPGTYNILYAAYNAENVLVTAIRTVVINPIPYMFKPEGGTFSWDASGVPGQPYLVAVNRAQNTVTVYAKDENNNYTVPVKAMACSVGREGHETPTGRYVTTDRYDWCYMVDGSWGRYAIRVYMGIMFHTVCYYTKSIDDLEYDEFNKLGNPASLGCIRLCVEDELWLYTNCPTGFVTVIYDDYALSGPLGKPDTIKIDTTNEEERGWDPTDPEIPF